MLWRNCGQEEFGRDCYSLVRTIALRVVQFHRSRPPEDTSWTRSAVDELVQGFLADKDGPARLLRYADSLADQHEFELLIERTIKNYLADRARQTEQGRLYRRIDRALSRDRRFTLVGGSSWSLEPSVMAHWSGSDEDLFAAARRAFGELPPPPSGTRTPGSVTARELADICAAVLARGAAPVPIATIVAVVADALSVSDRRVLPLTEREAPQAAMTTGLCRLIAEDIWQRLSTRERLLLPHLSGRRASKQRKREWATVKPRWRPSGSKNACGSSSMARMPATRRRFSAISWNDKPSG